MQKEADVSDINSKMNSVKNNGESIETVVDFESLIEHCIVERLPSDSHNVENNIKSDDNVKTEYRTFEDRTQPNAESLCDFINETNRNVKDTNENIVSAEHVSIEVIEDVNNITKRYDVPDEIPDIDEIFDFIDAITYDKNKDVNISDLHTVYDIDERATKVLKPCVEFKVEENDIDEEMFDLDKFNAACDMTELGDINNEETNLQKPCEIHLNESKIIFPVAETLRQAFTETSEFNTGSGTVEIEISKDNVVSISQGNPYDEAMISSDGESSNEDDSDYCEGYHSSDFEFISESEAKIGGLINNYTRKEKLNNEANSKPQQNDTNMPKEAHTFLANHNQSTHTENKVNDPNTIENVANTREYYRRLRIQFLVQQRTDNRLNHSVPEGENYYDLFRDTVPANLSYADKSVRPTTSMNVKYEGLGFDMRLVTHDAEEEKEYRNEAAETAKRILQMYPNENSKRRRR